MQAGGDSDSALVEASRRGDRDAYARIVERYQRAVYAVSFSTVRDRTLSDDITQDTFVTAWRRLGELRDVTRLPAWLCGIARNHARDARKRRARERAPVDVAGAKTPFDALSDAETDRLIAAALAEIPDAYREPLVLFYFEQRSASDVARTLAISEAAVHQRLSRGRRHLAEQMIVVVERGVARRGPKPELVACVIAAIGLPPIATAKGSTMPIKSSFVAIAITLGAAGVMSADVARKPKATAKPTPGKPASTPVPQLPAVIKAPDCSATGAHLADLLALPQLAKYYADKCAKETWSENVRLCIVDADDYSRVRVDCTDDAPANAAEVAAMPAHLECKAVAQHLVALANGPDGKYTMMRKKLARTTEDVAKIDRMAVVMTGETERECDERPWSVARRTCIVAAKTHKAIADCPK